MFGFWYLSIWCSVQKYRMSYPCLCCAFVIALISTMEPLKHQLHIEMTQKLTSTDHLLKENITKLVHSKVKSSFSLTAKLVGTYTLSFHIFWSYASVRVSHLLLVPLYLTVFLNFCIQYHNYCKSCVCLYSQTILTWNVIKMVWLKV
jgi:hypothetical protein